MITICTSARNHISMRVGGVQLVLILSALSLLFQTDSAEAIGHRMSREEMEERLKRFGSNNIGIAGHVARHRPVGGPDDPAMETETTGEGPAMPVEAEVIGGVQSSRKMKWPELVGMSGKEAADKIKMESPGLKTAIVPSGAMVTMDHRMDRVRIFVDQSGKVSKPPKLG